MPPGRKLFQSRYLRTGAHLVRQLLGQGGEGSAHHFIRLPTDCQILQLRLERAALQTSHQPMS